MFTAGEVIADIPRIYTAIAEWVACLAYLAVTFTTAPNRRQWLRLIASTVVGLVVLVAIHEVAGRLPLGLWIPGMVVAISAMLGIIATATQLPRRSVGYLGARAFVFAELLAGAHWQFASFASGEQSNPLSPTALAVLVGVYLLCGVAVYALERHHLTRDQLIQLTRVDLLSATIIAILTFAVSNLSFVSVNTPLSAPLGAGAGTVRMLVDACGFLLLYVHHRQVTQMRAQSEREAIAALLRTQHQIYLESQRNIEAAQRVTHDLKHHVAALRAEIDPQSRSQVLAELEQSVADMGTQLVTGHPVIDTVINSKLRICRQEGIAFTVMADGRALDFMSPFDASSLFGNALDNAIEACRFLPDGLERMIALRIHSRGQLVFITVENTYDGHLQLASNALPLTRKNRPGHGLGLKSIRYTAGLYDGTVSISHTQDTFVLSIMLPQPNEPKGAKPH